MKVSALSLAFLGVASASPFGERATKIKTLVTFGDSYTDQSRLGVWYTNMTAPPPHYHEVYPPLAAAADGGTSWVRYAEIYGGIKTYNYAVSGAACSNKLTGRPGVGPPAYTDGLFPSVTEYEIPTLYTDWAKNGKLTLDPETTVYSIWIGTNDVGYGSLLTGNQTSGVTIVNVTECVIKWAENLYQHGARNFIFQNMIPLELTPLYGTIDQPLDRYWKVPRNRTQYSIQMRELVNAGNALWDLQVPAAIASKMPQAKAAIFNSNQLFRNMYYNPSQYLNGSAPLNVTGYAAHSTINGTNTTVSSSPDSFLWYDSLHPSEQADRHVARQIVKTLQKTSQYATYYPKGGW